MPAVVFVKFACGQVPVTPAALVTPSVMVQVVTPAAMSAPETVMVLIPAVAVRTKAAPPVLAQLPPNVAGEATTSPAGNVSVNPRSLVAGADAGFDIVNVSVDVSPLPISVGVNALVKPGCATIERVALTLLVIPGDSPLIFPALFVYVAAEATVTVVAIVQFPTPIPRLPPLNVTVFPPMEPATVPPH